MRWLKRLGIALGVLLLLIVAASWWLLDTGAGLRFVIARAQTATHGALHIEQTEGSVLGPLHLRGIHYQNADGLDVAVASVKTDLRFWPLLSKTLRITTLNVEGIAVTLPSTPASTSSEADASLSLQPPINIVLDQAHIGALKISQDSAPVFAAQRIDLAGRWTHAGVVLTQLALRAADGHADISGQLGIGKHYRGDGKADFAWTVGDITYAGSLSASSDGALAHATLAFTQPTAAELQLQLQQHGALPWTAHLRVAAFDPKSLLGDSAVHRLAVNIQGSGDHHGGNLHGSIDVNDYAVMLQPLRAHFSDDWTSLTLDELVLTSAQIKGQLQANGSVQLDAQPLSGKLDVHWQNVELPADLVGQTLASHGSLSAS
ncbi:MAG: pathogenicity protein, partial [Xanthomonadales bacterium]|nr:pathogenicity protein [Xanthomonadales bacterium]